MTSRVLTRRDHARALALLLVLLGHAVYALPVPPAITRADMRKEWRQRELALWHGWLASIGIDVSRQELSDGLIRWTGRLAAAQRTLKTPFRPMFDLVGANQAWALFASSTTQPDRLVVEIEVDGAWTPLLRRLDPCCTWRDDQLRYRRIRGVWDAQDRMRPAYKGLTLWIAREALLEHPEASRARIHLERSHSTWPWEPEDPSVAVVHQRVHDRASVGLEP